MGNDKGDNEVESWAVHRSPDIYFMTGENPAKRQIDRLMKGVRPVIASNGVSYLLTWSEMYVVKRKRKKEMTG